MVMRKHMKWIPILITLIAVVGITWVSGNKSNSDQKDMVYAKDEQDNVDKFNSSSDVLKVGDSPYPQSNESNSAVYTMHIISNSITGNGTFDNGGEQFSDNDIKKEITNIKDETKK